MLVKYNPRADLSQLSNIDQRLVWTWTRLAPALAALQLKPEAEDRRNDILLQVCLEVLRNMVHEKLPKNLKNLYLASLLLASVLRAFRPCLEACFEDLSSLLDWVNATSKLLPLPKDDL